MIDIGPLHPQIVHFVVALGFIGVAFRLVSLSGKLPWTKQAATALTLIAALEQGHEAACPDASDADHLQREVDEPITLDELAPALGQ